MSDSASEKDDISQRKLQAGHYLWVVLPLVTGASFAQALMRQGIPVLYPFIQTEFGLSRAQVGLVISFMAIGIAVAVILAGWLTDTFGVKRTVTIAMLFLTASILAFPLAYSFQLVLGLVVIIGIVLSPINPATLRVVIDWFPIRIRALAMGVRQMGVPIAGALTAAVLPALALLTSWRMAAATTSLLVLAIAIAFILLYRDVPRGVQKTPKFNLITLKTILQNRGLVMSIIWATMFIGLGVITLSYFMLFLIEELELSPIMAGGLLALAQVSSIIARVLWGAISDFVFHGRRIVVLAFIGLLTILWMLGASSIDVGVSNITVYLIAIVMGISTLSYQGVLFTLIGEQAMPGQVGVTVGVAETAMQVSQIVLPPLFGHLVDISNSYSLGWRATAIVALVSTLALLAFGREPKDS